MSDPEAFPVTSEMVASAADALAGRIVDTPCAASPALSELTGATVWVKLENFQRTGSFKDRGALNRLLALDPAERSRGVVAASAGNHAQGVAYHARTLGVPATIVVPAGTPFTKIARTQQLGAEVVVEGTGVAAAMAVAVGIAERDGRVLVHPYDDPLVIAGQGTVGIEIATAVPHADAVIVPVGGGGLLAGVAVALRAGEPARMRDAELVGVQSELFPAMTERFHSGSAAPVRDTATIADGIAVTEPGVITTTLIRALADDLVTVHEATIEEAITHLLELEKTVAEGAGAAPLALLLDDPARYRGRTVVLVVSGGNIEPRLLASVVLRGLGRQGRLVRFLVDAEDSPGRLAALAAVIGEAGANIVEVEHGRLTSDIAVPPRSGELRGGDARRPPRRPGRGGAGLGRLRGRTPGPVSSVGRVEHDEPLGQTRNAGQEREVLSYCRICAAACGITVTVMSAAGEDDRVLRVRGDDGHPTSRGYTCSKGRGLAAWHHSPDRLDHPRVRGTRASWDDALDDLAAVVRATIDEHGPDAVAGYLATGAAYDTGGQVAAGAWLATIGSTSTYTAVTVDNAPVLVAAELVAGNPMLAPVWDPTVPGLLLLVATNPVVSHGYGTTLPDPVRYLRDYRGIGGRIWVIDPRRSETAALADEHLAARPGPTWLCWPRSRVSCSPTAPTTTS